MVEIILQFIDSIPTSVWAIGTILSIIAILAPRYWQITDRRENKDKELINKIIRTVPDSTISYLSNHYFENSYRIKTLQPLRELENLLKTGNTKFFDQKMEAIRMELKEEIIIFRELLHLKTFTRDNNTEMASLEKPYEIIRAIEASGKTLSEEEITKIEDDFRKNADKLDQLSTNVCQKYNLLVSMAYKKLP